MTRTLLGVAIVTFNSSDVIIDCLESLVAAAGADGVRLEITVLDNRSGDGCVDLVRAWAAGATDRGISDDLPFALSPVSKPLQGHRLTVLSAPFNSGFAGGVNRAVRHLMDNTLVDRVWILNPDGIVPPGTPGEVAAGPADFGLLGGRIFYHAPADTIQADGGRINSRTGVTRSINQNDRPGADASVRFPDGAALDYVCGAHLCVSRQFWDEIGPMDERYFLYYEEVDWAHRRGALTLKTNERSVIYHRAGTAIGSMSPERRASVMSVYFINRARHRFVARNFPGRAPWTWAYSLAKMAQFLLRRDVAAAGAILRGAADLPPPATVRARLSPEALAMIAGQQAAPPDDLAKQGQHAGKPQV